MAKKKSASKAPKKQELIDLPPLLLDHPFAAPEIPNRALWTASKIKMFRNCHRKFFWRYLMHLVPKSKSENLIIGDLFHRGIAEWLKTKKSMLAIIKGIIDPEIKELAKTASYYDQEDWNSLEAALQTLRGMLLGYSMIYKMDRKLWKLSKDRVEIKFRVDMGLFDLAGTIDVLPIIKNISFVVEHKTAKKIGDSYLERLPLDTQVRTYLVGAKQKLGKMPQKVLYNVIRKCALKRKCNETQSEYLERISLDYQARPDFYFYREKLRFSRKDIQAVLIEIQQTHSEYQHILDTVITLRDPRSWCPNDDTCNDYFKMCPYFVLCSKGLAQDTAHLFTIEKRDDIYENV